MPTGSDAPRRTYGEREVSAILRRASEMQRKQGSGPDAGLTLAELKSAATEAGIDPRFVERAAAELARGGSDGKRRFHPLGGPTSITLAQTVEGEVTDDIWELIRGEITSTLGVGTTEQRGATREWTVGGESTNLRQTQITVTSEEGRTHIRAYSAFGNMAIPMFLPVMMVSVILSLMLPIANGLPVAAIAAIFIGVVGAAYLLVSTSYRLISRRNEREMNRLVSRIEDIITQNAPPASREAPPVPEAAPGVRPQVSLPHGEAPATEAAPSGRDRLRG